MLVSVRYTVSKKTWFSVTVTALIVSQTHSSVFWISCIKQLNLKKTYIFISDAFVEVTLTKAADAAKMSEIKTWLVFLDLTSLMCRFQPQSLFKLK